MTNKKNQCIEKKAKPPSRLALLVSGEVCFFVTDHHHRILINYHYALSTSKTWGDFCKSLNKSTKEYLSAFSSPDDISAAEIKESVYMVDLMQELWVLYDDEFPTTQCAEETATLYGKLLPQEDISETITTEYGEEIYLYKISDTPKIVKKCEEAGLKVAIEEASFPIKLHHYR